MQKNPIPESGNNTDSQGWDLIIYKDTDQETVATCNVREQESNYSQNASFTNLFADKYGYRPGRPRLVRLLPRNACGLQPFRPCPEA